LDGSNAQTWLRDVICSGDTVASLNEYCVVSRHDSGINSMQLTNCEWRFPRRYSLFAVF
tara:strand:- start:202 stop:378 length:177 start_codon:yes stop_codon:yes gene_type:complete